VAALPPAAVVQAAAGVDRLGARAAVGVADGELAQFAAGCGDERDGALARDGRDVLAGALHVDVRGDAQRRGADVIDAGLDPDQVGGRRGGAGDTGER